MQPITTYTTAAFPDAIGKRLRWAIIASLILNVCIWRAAAAIAKHPGYFAPRPVEITRVIVDRKGHKTEKVVTKKQIAKKIAQVHKEIQHRRVASRPRPAPPRPQGAHHRVLLAKLDKNAPPPQPDEHTALEGGNADLGKPTDQQSPGNATTNPPEPVKKEPEPQPQPAKVEPKPEPAPAPAPVKVEPKPAPAPEPAPEPKPEPKPAPKPKGPTREAEPEDQVKPEIPEDLKHGEYKSFVRVKVEIDADGSFTPILRTSSGNPDIDNRVLEALKKWKWKPALKDGVPVKSTQLFKFEFLVE